MILVTGYGPFRDIADNPSERLVRALHGRVVAGHRVVALVLPVRWGDAPARAVRAIQELKPTLALGFGVATRRDRVEVERLARPRCEGEDVDGATAADAVGPDEVEARLDVARLAEALGAGVSDDAGTYLCNAWLYEVARRSDTPATFVHLPPEGVPPERVLSALETFLSAPAASATD